MCCNGFGLPETKPLAEKSIPAASAFVRWWSQKRGPLTAFRDFQPSPGRFVFVLGSCDAEWGVDSKSEQTVLS